MLEKDRQPEVGPFGTGGGDDGPSGITKVRELIYEVDMIKQAHQEKKRSQSRKSHQQKASMDR